MTGEFDIVSIFSANDIEEFSTRIVAMPNLAFAWPAFAATRPGPRAFHTMCALMNGQRVAL